MFFEWLNKKLQQGKSVQKKEPISKSYIFGSERSFILDKLNDSELIQMQKRAKEIVKNEAFSVIINDMIKKELDILQGVDLLPEDEKNAKIALKHIIFLEEAFVNFANAGEDMNKKINDQYSII